MKWLTRKKQSKQVQPETFLVLPLLENNNNNISISSSSNNIDNSLTVFNSADDVNGMPSGMRLFTKKLGMGTWPPKHQEKKKRKSVEEIQRPLTATLERPQLLNIKLINTLDMSKVRKEFLCISNLCSIPLTNIRNRRKTYASDYGHRRRSIPGRPLSLPSSDLKLSVKSPKRLDVSGEDSWEEDEMSTRSVREKLSTKKSTKLKMTSGIPKKQAKQSGNSVREKHRMSSSDPNNNAKSSSTNQSNSSSPASTATYNSMNGNSVQDSNNKVSSKKTITPLTTTKNSSVNSKSSNDGSAGGAGGGAAPGPPGQLQPRKIPEPCKTCGRPDQPERFHSHPVATAKPKETIKKIPMKKTVQKPMAIKFKSKKSSEIAPTAADALNVASSTTTISPTKPTPTQKVNNSSIKSPQTNNKSDVRVSSAGKGPRTLTCYLCGREFGSASLPLHEPKCLEKWERENSQLPVSMRRKAPIKPDKPLTSEEWNDFAWKASQASLTPCKNCGRTFLPERLLVHMRSCKPTTDVKKVSLTQSNNNLKSAKENMSNSKDLIPAASPSRTKSGTANPTTIPCYVCGRMFGTKSIGIHEPQCLKKWHMQNDMLPPDQREPVPLKPAPTPKSTPEPEETIREEVQSIRPDAEKSGSQSKIDSKSPPMFPCYLCGRLFDVNSIYEHEPECLKKWREENDKLSPSKRRQEPLKPDIKFTPLGTLDFEEASDASWQNHLNQLVPCNMCGRKFTPDRVEIHERSCKASGGVDYVGTFNRIWDNHLNELVECKNCGRKFFPDRIEKHVAACNGLKINLKGNKQ